MVNKPLHYLSWWSQRSISYIMFSEIALIIFALHQSITFDISRKYIWYFYWNFFHFFIFTGSLINWIIHSGSNKSPPNSDLLQQQRILALSIVFLLIPAHCPPHHTSLQKTQIDARATNQSNGGQQFTHISGMQGWNMHSGHGAAYQLVDNWFFFLRGKKSN